MRSDNSQHLLAAARQRVSADPAPGEGRVRRLADNRQRRSLRLRRPAKPASPAPGSTPNPTCAPRSPGSANAATSDPSRRATRAATRHPRPRCFAGSRPQPIGSADSSKTTINSKPRSHKHSGQSQEPPSPGDAPSHDTPTNRLHKSPARDRGPLPLPLMETVHDTFVQVRGHASAVSSR